MQKNRLEAFSDGVTAIIITIMAGAIGSDWKGKLSILCYFAAIGLAFVNQWLSDALYVFVAVMWLIPDRRVERTLAKREG